MCSLSGDGSKINILLLIQIMAAHAQNLEGGSASMTRGPIVGMGVYQLTPPPEILATTSMGVLKERIHIF